MRSIGVSKVCPMCRGRKTNGQRQPCELCKGRGIIDTHPSIDPSPAPKPAKRHPLIQRTSLSVAWANYEREVLDPIGAGQAQRKDMRRAWYNGIAWLMDQLTYTLDEGEEATVDDLKHLDDIMDELTEFAEKIKRGDA